jgi:hypothetical protein
MIIFLLYCTSQVGQCEIGTNDGEFGTLLVQTIFILKESTQKRTLIMFTQETVHDLPDRPPRHRSYLLRCWEVRDQRPVCPSSWRFSLQDSQTGERHHFADLGSLLAFLQGTFDDNNTVGH